jgi:RND family efflux transporter MFP subunit
VTLATINDRLQAIGTGRANASVTVNPYDSGRLTEVTVTAGSMVEKSQIIARLESETEQIAVDRAKIAERDAAAKFERATSLRASNAGTAVQVADAEMALANAKLALRDAELALERRSIVAPIAGIVGILPIEAGNYVTTQTAIATIDDRSSIVVDFWVPERYASTIAVGTALTATPIARPNEVFDGTVSAVDNRLDEASRTLRVQARIANENDQLRAGMSFQVLMKFPGDSYPSVNPLAIQWGTDGSFVWAVRDGKAKRTPVRIIQRNTENVLVEAELAENDRVVTEGIYVVREGAELLIANDEAAPAPPPAVASDSGS